MSDGADAPLCVRLYSPIPPARADDHGGLKLDWGSDVGRTGSLLEWRPVGRGGDGGVPVSVAQALATGLCAVLTVAGCTLHLPADVGATWTGVPGGQACLLRAPWWRGSRYDVGLLASRDPTVVAALFDDDTFPWWNEGQLLFLAPADTLPRLDLGLVAACFQLPIRATTAQLAAAGVVGLIVSGVDGDVAGLYLLDPALRPPIVGALAAAVTAAGGVWEERDGMAHPFLQVAGIDARGSDERLPPA